MEYKQRNVNILVDVCKQRKKEKKNECKIKNNKIKLPYERFNVYIFLTAININ
jgi:hypothetical protein